MSSRKRRPSHRRVKSLRNYTIADVSQLLEIHRRTVREWIKRGLPIVDNRRPILIHGSDLRAFLLSRRQRRKRCCGPGEIFCVKCRTAKAPAAGIADYLPISSTRGTLVGICPTCDTVIRRWASLAQLESVEGKLEVTIMAAQLRISDTSDAAVDCHLEPVG